jgi:hypothetical protein
MLNNRQKRLLENQIYRMLKESMFENGFYENGFFEKENEHKHHDEEEHEDEEHAHYEGDSESRGDIEHKREIVMKWLDSDLELHSTLAYELYPDKRGNENDEGAARSLFSKKYKGKDPTGKPYSFDSEEINKLYNLRNKFIKQRGLDKK